MKQEKRIEKRKRRVIKLNLKSLRKTKRKKEEKEKPESH